MVPFVEELRLACGFAARALCNGEFVCGLERKRTRREDVGFHPLFRLVSARIDREERSVTASLLGALQQKALFVEGIGSVLLSGAPEQDVRSWRTAALTPRPAGLDSVPWPAGDLVPTASGAAGFDLERVMKAADGLFAEAGGQKKLRTRALLVVQEGRLVLERYAPGITKDTRLPSWSMAKSVTSCLVGCLVAEGRLALPERAPVPAWEGASDPRRSITLDQLLRMSSGLQWTETYADQPISDVNRMLFLEPDMASYAAGKPLEAAPDSLWCYSSGTANIVCRIMRDAFPSREQYWAFPRQALFDRIGMYSALFATDATGTLVGSSLVYATARDFARFGLLCLNDGVWQGERILPEGWIRYATTPTPAAPKGEYGAFFWLNRGPRGDPANRPSPRLPPDAFFAFGYQGQMIAMLPSRRMVVVRLGMTYGDDWGLEDFLATVLAD